MHDKLSRRKGAVPVALFLVSALLAAAPTYASEVSQKTAVVLEPKVDGPIIPQDFALIEKAVQTALSEQQFQVASKAERDSIASAENIKSCYRNDCLERLGRLLGAHSVLAYKIRLAIVEVPPAPVQEPPPPSKKGRRAEQQAQQVEQTAATSPLNWEVTAALYNIEVGAIGARVEMKCEHCSGPQVAQNTADLIKRAVLEDASKVREVLEITSNPGNSSVLVDGVELGVTPYRRQTFVGKHDITIRHTGYKSTNQEITVGENHKTSLNITLEPGRDPVKYIQEYQPRPKWRLAVGGALIGLGVIGMGIGAYGLAINGKCTADPEPPSAVCPMVYQGLPAGLGFLVTGGVVAATGAVMMILPGKRNPLTLDNAADTFGDKNSGEGGDQPAQKPADKTAPRVGLSLGGPGGLGLAVFGTY
jgi:hypothetical protein